MTWSAAAVRNLNFFFRLSAARRLRLLFIGSGGGLKVLTFFPPSAARRLCLFLIGGVVARKFTNEKFFPK
jgi:hypothetical protein